uniref:Fibronectin type-III domain-containing protein n=1 Tax=Lates calcarifer TaxID=8187 RepID=A0A4W6E4T4_LATCA
MVHCWCASYPNLTLCSWPEPALSPPTHYILWHCHLPNLKLLTDYIINVTAVHSGGSSSPTCNLVPFVNVIRNLLVEWSPPPTWANLDIFPLKYQIMYQWENRGTPKFVSLGPFENTRVELRGLTPGKVYQFQVCAKELLGLGECSNWSSPVNITIPRRKP